MKALVLAAGCGRRLWPLTALQPKCLLQLDGTTILEQQLHGLRRTGVQSVVIVCGHGHDRVEQFLAGRCSAGQIQVRLAYNPFYSLADNLVSLWTARAELDQELVLLNGDAVFQPEVFDVLAMAPAPCCLLLARKAAYTADDMKVRLDGDCVTAIGKHLPPATADAAAIGALRFSPHGVRQLRAELERSMQQPENLHCHFPRVIQGLVDRGEQVSGVDIGGLAWADVDTPEDLAHVRRNLSLFCAGAVGGRAADRT